MVTIILVLVATFFLIMVASLALAFVWLMVEIGWKLLLGKAIFDGILFIAAGLFGTFAILFTTFKIGEWLGNYIDRHDDSLERAFKHVAKHGKA